MANMQPNNSGGGPANGAYSQPYESQHNPGHVGPPQPTISRPFTLQESLPYSPQTSTIPFISDIIPNPTLGSGSPALRISDLFPTHEFDNLNREALGQAQVPRSLKQAVDHVLQDLKPNQRTHYKFCTVPRNSTTPAPGASLADNMSPLTRTIFDKVGGFFKATKPNVHDSKIPNGQASHQIAKQASPPIKSSPAPPTSSIPARNSQAHRSNNVRIEVAIPLKRHFDGSDYIDATSFGPLETSPVVQQQQLIPPHPPQSSTPIVTAAPGPVLEYDRNPSIRIELPRANINREEYIEVEEAPETPHNLSVRKAQRQGFSDSQDLIGESLDQRQRGEAALDALDRLVRTTFSAVGSALAMEPGGYGGIVTMTPEQEVTMTASTQQKMHGAIQKTIGLKCYDRVPVEHLLQITKLSVPSFKQLDNVEIRIDETWSDDAMDTWVQQLSDVEVALKAARTCLRILTGGREDKQLYSEAVIQKGVDIFKTVTEDVIIPVVELRGSGSAANVFKLLSRHKKAITPIFVCCQKLFALLAELVTKIELSDTVITTLEFTATRLIFVENAYFEKDSAVGVQRFDGIRSVAMDMLCQIFLVKPQQRQGIIDEILTSLEKLPVGKQSARQFRLSDGGSIQPVSALIMRLVQASSGTVDQSREQNRKAMMRSLDQNGDEEDEDDGEGSATGNRRVVSSIKSEEQGAYQHSVAIKELETVVAPLTQTAHGNVRYVIGFIVRRAIGSSKSGDTPYRNLLDLFVEDFTTCLDSPDWPSSELLLCNLMATMMSLFEAPKTAAPAKNMALEILGGMSAAISRLRSHVKKMAGSFEGSDADELSRYLSDLANHALEQKSRPEQIASWAGPYRATLEYLQHRCTDDPHLSSAISFLIADWANRVHTCYDSFQDDDNERDRELGRLGYRLRMMVEDRKWLVNEYTFKLVSASQAKLSYSVILLSSVLCQSFSTILGILLGSMGSDQATVRSKSLKSINQVLETDPSILDGNSTVVDRIVDCTCDSSIQVRDSALGLLGNCITMRPALEASLTPKIIDRFSDNGVGVRKRAMKLARDVYLRNRIKGLRSAIANGLLRRVQDPDEGVRDLARQMIEEVWFSPFYHDDGGATYQTSLTEHVALIIQTARGGNATDTLDKVFQTILEPQNKSSEGPFLVCSKLVANMFGLIDNPDSDDPSVPAGKDALHVLTIFAKADARLFNFEQIRLLKPNLSLTATEDLATFRAVTIIYRRVLPQLGIVHPEFLLDIRGLLLKSFGKIPTRQVLDDAVACAKVVCDLSKGIRPMAMAVLSSLQGIRKMQPSLAKSLGASVLTMYTRYCRLIGTICKHCDLDGEIQLFKERFPKWKGNSVPRLAVDVLIPFAAPSQPLDIRKAALEAVGLVCQSWPRNYVVAQVYTTFQQVFDEREAVLEMSILTSIREFLLTEEKRSEAATEVSGTEKKKKELTVMGGTNFDDVATTTTQRFLADITRIALAGQDDHAFLAVEVLASVNRQGLTHPKATGVTLITLETSANPKIAELAFSEHRALHAKHETIVEREYAKAVQSAYAYQRDVVGDSHGATTEPFQSKLHFLIEVLKISKMRNRQRFLEKLCTQVDFDLAKLDAVPELPPHVDFSRFILENLAFFEYQAVGELQTTVNLIEKIVSSTGTTVAQAIEAEVFNVSVDFDQPAGSAESAEVPTVDGETITVQPATAALTVEPARFRQLTAASIVLLLMWEVRTHLRRLYGMGTNRHDSKAKALAKDLNKTPVKVQGVHGERVWEEMQSHVRGLQDQESMLRKCKAFVELMNVDKELKVVEEDDQMDMDGPATPSEGEDEDVAMDRGRKRKGGSTPGGRKKRARSGSQPRKRGRPRKQSVEQDFEADLDGDWI